MNKKTIIGIVIALIVVIVAVVGYVMLGNSNENNRTAKTNDMNKELSTQNSNEQLNNTDNENNTETLNNNGKILIAYFSETGNTEKFANIIKEQTGGDLFKIEPATPYPTGEELFDYTREEQEEDRRPEVKYKVDISKYDTIFIGYPIWWYEVPQIIKTFLDEYDLSGKTVIPFNTHEGSGDGGTYRYIEEQEPNANVLEGLPIRGGNMQEDQTENISNWLNELGF